MQRQKLSQCHEGPQQITMSFWDQQYSTPDFKYGTQANWFLRNQAAHLHPGSEVLLPGDGEGRNSVWLARRGHHVTAVDNSRVGLDKASRLAAENGVAVALIEADLEHWVPTPDSFDAVVLTYVHLPESWRHIAHQRLTSALRPGGWFILEAFHPLQLGYSSGGPKDESLLYTIDMIRSDLAAQPEVILDEVLAWEGEAHLDEGSGHQGSAHLTRYVAHRVKSRNPDTNA